MASEDRHELRNVNPGLECLYQSLAAIQSSDDPLLLPVYDGLMDQYRALSETVEPVHIDQYGQMSLKLAAEFCRVLIDAIRRSNMVYDARTLPLVVKSNDGYSVGFPAIGDSKTFATNAHMQGLIDGFCMARGEGKFSQDGSDAR